MSESKTDADRLEMAWAIIANATDWDRPERAQWKAAAERWRDNYFASLSSEGPMADMTEGGEDG